MKYVKQFEAEISSSSLQFVRFPTLAAFTYLNYFIYICIFIASPQFCMWFWNVENVSTSCIWIFHKKRTQHFPFRIFFTSHFICWWCRTIFILITISTTQKKSFYENGFKYFISLFYLRYANKCINKNAKELGRIAWSLGNALSWNESAFISMYRRTWWLVDTPLLLGKTWIRAHCNRYCKGKTENHCQRNESHEYLKANGERLKRRYNSISHSRCLF